ncbi:MAG: GTP pyrophosphokinase family protein [Clostridia bacterium]|nr:GTP pyrophosphokinase family protein [Clostridia bacterium]
MIYWKDFLLPYEQAVEELKIKFKSLRDEYRKRSEFSPIEFVTGRVKAVPSIIDKAKKMGYSEDHISEMEDIAGIRIMCQFEDDIYKVIELIKNRDGIDLNIMHEKNYIENKKESGYRSYHMIIKYPVITVKGLTEVLAEVQIRTLAMNFWATIEHSLNYKYRGNIPANIVEKLKKSAEAAYQLDQEMLAIRDEVIDAQELFSLKSNTVTRIISYINMLENIGEKETAIFYRKKLNDTIESFDDNSNQKLLKNIAEELRVITERKHA